jgi:hypothetical protein
MGLSIGRVSDILNDESSINLLSRDCLNHMRNLRVTNSEMDDAKSIFQYCRMKQAQHSNFYYSIYQMKKVE